jgi:hypothetical protein
VFGGLSVGRTTQSSGSGTRDEVAANSVLDDAQNEIQNNDALAVGEHVVIQRIPEASQVTSTGLAISRVHWSPEYWQAFHPSDIINQYLLNMEPSANIAITHDDDWITMLEEDLLKPEDLVQEGRLESLVSQKYNIISEEGVVYLKNRSESDTLNADIVDATMEGRKLDSEDSDVLVIDAVPAGVQVRLSYDVTNSSEERSHPTG